MIAELRSMAHAAVHDARLLAYHLTDFSLYDVCCRLDCTLTTTLLLTLSDAPRSGCWQADVTRLAAERHVDCAALASLLRDAEAVAWTHRG